MIPCWIGFCPLFSLVLSHLVIGNTLEWGKEGRGGSPTGGWGGDQAGHLAALLLGLLVCLSNYEE